MDVKHGIIFKRKHTWRDWGLVPTSRPVFNPPSVKTIYVDIPGADGKLDLTEDLNGCVNYENRTGSFEFYVANTKKWIAVYSEIMSYLHGKKLEAVLDDDINYKYVGRFFVNNWKSGEYNSVITIDYDVEPYKIELSSSLEPWEWDSFNFETGVIREYKEVPINGTLDFMIPGTQKRTVPTIIADVVSGTMTVEFEGVSYQIKNGENRIVQMLIKEGENHLVFKGKGTISVDYRGGML